MDDQATDQDAAQANIATLHASVDAIGIEIFQKWDETSHAAKVVRRLPEECLWCLHCHQIGHRNIYDYCDATPPEIHEVDSWDLLSITRLDPRYQEDEDWPDLRRLVNLLSILEVETSQFDQYIHHRDALLREIHFQTRTWITWLEHETWFHFMSAFHMIVHRHRVQVRTILDRLQRLRFAYGAPDPWDALTFLRRVRGQWLVMDDDEVEIVRGIVYDLESATESFHEQFSIFVADMEEEYLPFLAHFMRNNPRFDWMCSAYRVLVRIQPSLDLSDTYIARWSYPDIDSVVRSEGLVL